MPSLEQPGTEPLLGIAELMTQRRRGEVQFAACGSEAPCFRNCGDQLKVTEFQGHEIDERSST